MVSRFKDAKAPFCIVIVRDMWLTGFHAPCLPTMYADKPLQGHGLMQAIAGGCRLSSPGRKRGAFARWNSPLVGRAVTWRGGYAEGRGATGWVSAS